MRNSKGQFIKGVYVGFGFKKMHVPWNKDKKGIHLSSASEFKKGMTPWNKDTRGLIKPNSGSITKGEHRGLKTEIKIGQFKEERHPKWKGDKVGYDGLHSWIQRNYGKAKKCENREKQFLPFACNRKSINFDWANKSLEYRRNMNDWVELCHSCHLKADKNKITLC